GFARVAGQVRGQVFRAGQRRHPREYAGEEGGQAVGVFLGQRRGPTAPEGLRVRRQRGAAFDTDLPVRVADHPPEVAVVGDEHAAVVLPVARDLLAVGRLRRVLAGRLDFDDAAQDAGLAFDPAEVGPSGAGIG